MDPLTKDYPSWSPYPFAMNRVIDGVDLDGLEYLRADESRIELYGGCAYLKLDNCYVRTRTAWKWIDRKYLGPGDGSLGWSRQIGKLSHPTLPKTPADMSTMDNTITGDVDPNYNPGYQKLKQLRNDVPLQRQAQRHNDIRGGVSSMAPVSGKAAAGVMLLVESINFGGATLGQWMLDKDQELLEEHKGILINKVMTDINIAIDKDIIPEEYQNLNDISSIANVILSGTNTSGNEEIYNLGMEIYNAISSPPIQIIFTKTQEGQDNAVVKKTIIAPKIK